ncbi:MAG TPA: IS110 family transposase [Bacteroidales bacterium]|jgi:transposase|nr:IS110 family transposase [Bacteroidota bacterium]HJN05243.1 IS110 family transposase [Bacteroidales bacterium]|tara:strand:- start:545 stop:1543 length:999 start_codon:yes stop_codon:yes gene_type:complete
MKFTSFIGIDISKLDYDVAHLDVNGTVVDTKKFSNNSSGFRSMLSWIKKSSATEQLLFCLEHTGVYCLGICVFFEEYGLNYSLQSGLQIKRSMGIQRGKNDKADACVIGKYAYLNRNEIDCYRLPSRIILKLKQLVSYRERLVKSNVALKIAAKELKAFTDKDMHGYIVSDSQEHIKHITKSIIEIDHSLKQIVAEDPALNRMFKLITSVKGVGLHIAINMIVVTHGFTRFKNWRKFSCYCGLAPFEHRSGSSIRGKTKVSHLGNKKIKAIIGNGIASAIQHDPEIASYYKRKLEEGKHKMVVMNAIKNKLISRVFAVVKRGTPFVPLYQHI